MSHVTRAKGTLATNTLTQVPLTQVPLERLCDGCIRLSYA